MTNKAIWLGADIQWHLSVRLINIEIVRFTHISNTPIHNWNAQGREIIHSNATEGLDSASFDTQFRTYE